MDDQRLIADTVEFVKNTMTGDSGHDWWHVYRVWQLAKTIASSEPAANLVIVELGALLHDIADWKFHDKDLEAGPRVARTWLEKHDVAEIVITAVADIIRDTSFKGAGVELSLTTIEAKIISDADKLDAMGAIGIARAFVYGGSKNHSIHEPDQKPTPHKTFAEYQSNEPSMINHFYEKLLLLKNLMQTETGKKLAEHRHDYMVNFLDQFYQEWNGEI